MWELLLLSQVPQAGLLVQLQLQGRLLVHLWQKRQVKYGIICLENNE